MTLIREMTVPGLDPSETTLDSEVTSMSGLLSFTSITFIITLQFVVIGGWPLSEAVTSALYTSVSSKSSVPFTRISPEILSTSKVS